MSLLRRFVWRLRVRFSRGYLLVCDDRGTTRWPSKSKTWCIGGYLIPYWNRYQLFEVWRKLKDELTADPSSELKWSHFFSGTHQEFSENPLISKNQIIWREQAKWALDQLTDVTGLVPINTYVRKDQASDDLFVSAKKHTAEAAFAAHVLPFEIFLLTMLLEEHKEVMRLRQEIDKIIEN